MSDNESDISEDIVYRSDDGSDTYHAAEDDFELENDKFAELPQQKPFNLQSRPFERKATNSENKENELKNAPNISRINSTSDHGYNDYSTDFDDVVAQSNESLMYSDNFDTDGFKADLDPSENRAVISKFGGNSDAILPVSTQQNLLQFPGINLASLQAEIALEEISKEVVRLRNQQRSLLQERRHIAREKKTRADSRRTQYQLELRDMRQKLIESDDACKSQAQQTSQIQKSWESAIYSRKIIESELEMKEVELKDVMEKVSEVQKKLAESMSTLAIERCEFRAKEEKWILEKGDLTAGILRANMLAAVVQQSLEANESRLSRERDRLPEEHRRLLDEQMSRNKALEGSIIDRERSLIAEETRRFAMLEKRAKESAEDISRSKIRAEVELSEDRQKLQDQQQSLLQERREAQADIARERSDLSVIQVNLARREASLLADAANLKDLRGEFEAAKLAVEPILRATATDREDARKLLERAENIALDAEEHAAGILLAERGLVLKEQEAAQRGAIAEGVRSKYFEARKVLQIEAVKLINSQKDLSSEKFRLHGAAIELASQADEVRHTVGMISKYTRASRKISATSQPDSYLALQRDDDIKNKISTQAKEGGIFIGAPPRRKSIESLNFTNFDINEAKYDAEHKSKVSSIYPIDDIDNDEINSVEAESRCQELQAYAPSIESESGTGTGTPRYSKRQFHDFSHTANEIDQMAKLNHVSISIGKLAEKLSGRLSKPFFSQPDSHITVSIDDRQAPYESTGEDDNCSDRMRCLTGHEKDGSSSSLPIYYAKDAVQYDGYKAINDPLQDYRAYEVLLDDTYDTRRDSRKKLELVNEREAFTKNDKNSSSTRISNIIPGSLHDFVDSDLRSSVECASFQANGLSLAAAKYGIFR